jgi:hypothetical protein
MKRLEFIHRLLAFVGFSLLPGKSMQAKQYRKFYLLQCFVRGFQYYEGPSWISQMKEGDLLELVREPDNAYDQAAMLSKLLDIGVPALIAEITFLEPRAAAWENVAVAIYVLKEIPVLEQVSSSTACLTRLETPQYRSLRRADQTSSAIM